jgi:hypothetical protein
MDIHQQIKDLKIVLATLESKASNIPSKGDMIYTPIHHPYGNEWTIESYIWGESPSLEKSMLENKTKIYKKREECQAVVNQKNATIAVEKRVDELNDGWVPDWSDSKEYKNYISYNCFNFCFSIGWSKFSNTNKFYLKDQESAELIIKEMGKELRLMFGVK